MLQVTVLQVTVLARAVLTQQDTTEEAAEAAQEADWYQQSVGLLNELREQHRATQQVGQQVGQQDEAHELRHRLQAVEAELLQLRAIQAVVPENPPEVPHSTLRALDAQNEQLRQQLVVAEQELVRMRLVNASTDARTTNALQVYSAGCEVKKALLASEHQCSSLQLRVADEARGAQQAVGELAVTRGLLEATQGEAAALRSRVQSLETDLDELMGELGRRHEGQVVALRRVMDNTVKQLKQELTETDSPDPEVRGQLHVRWLLSADCRCICISRSWCSGWSRSSSSGWSSRWSSGWSSRWSNTSSKWLLNESRWSSRWQQRESRWQQVCGSCSSTAQCFRPTSTV